MILDECKDTYALTGDSVILLDINLGILFTVI